MLKFSSTTEALQHLSDITGKKIKVGAINLTKAKLEFRIESIKDLIYKSNDVGWNDASDKESWNKFNSSLDKIDEELAIVGNLFDQEK